MFELCPCHNTFFSLFFLSDGRNFDKIISRKKTGVDPYPTKKITGLHQITSDEFFKINENYFDIIFVDGLHLENQVDKDLEGVLIFYLRVGL